MRSLAMAVRSIEAALRNGEVDAPRSGHYMLGLSNVGIQMAQNLDVSPDPFLMAVAVAASAAFLTPIGHKNNTLILGPGGYHFGDYWRMGLPLEILVVAVSIPSILLFWPL